MTETGRSLLKWVGGILATVIAALIVWWITRSVGAEPIHPVTDTIATIEQPKPKVIITEFKIDEPLNIDKSSTTKATVTVFNEGEIAAIECDVWWASHGKKFAPFGTEPFTLVSKKSKKFKIQSGIYNKPSSYETFVYVKCKNCLSDTLYRNIHVFRLN